MRTQTPSIATIRQAIAIRFGITDAALRGPTREHVVAHPRQAAMWLARRLTRHSTVTIGRAFGGRDHTTVCHAVRAVESRRAADPALATTLRRLERELCEPGPGFEDEDATRL